MALSFLDMAPTTAQQGQSGQNTASAAQVKQLRDLADALMEQKQKPKYYGWANGLADLSGAYFGNKKMGEANQVEAARNKKWQDSTPDAAQGGADAGAPFQEAEEAGGEDLQRPRQLTPQRAGSQASLAGRASEGQRGPVQLAALASGKQGPSGGQKVAQDSQPSSRDAIAEAAMRLSSKGEVGTDQYAGLYKISPDTGGSKSYGPFGLNSKTGSAAQFAKDNPNLGLTAKPGTPEFDQQWRRAAAVMGDDFKQAHKDWHGKNIMSGLPESMIKAGVDPNIANSSKVQTYMADRKLQMGGAGLNSALMYAKLSHSPEEFVTRMSQVDKQRIPYNFASYLKGNPDNVKGLSNRIDLRHNTALAMADPETTGKMVDFQRDAQSRKQGVQVAQNGPPTQLAMADPETTGRAAPDTYRGSPGGQMGVQVAQNRPAQGSLEADVENKLRRHFYNMTPDELERNIKAYQERRSKVIPQYEDPNEYGIGIKRQFGVPSQYYAVPGAPGKIEPETDIGAGVMRRTYRDPKTGKIRVDLIPPTLEGEEESKNTPQPTAPPTNAPQPPVGGVSVQAPQAQPAQKPASAPAVKPPQGNGGPLVTAPPAVPPKAPAGPPQTDVQTQIAAKPGQKLALADTAGSVPAEKVMRTMLAQRAAEGDAQQQPGGHKVQTYDLENPKTPEELNANKELEWAKTHPSQPPTMPNILQQQFDASKAAQGMSKIDALKNIKPLSQIHERTVEDELKNQNKTSADLRKNMRDSEVQAVKLSPELKYAQDLLDEPDFHPGPANKWVEAVRGLREEATSLFGTWATDAKNRGDVASQAQWEKAAAWVKNNHSATSNQVYQKILSGSILQSLRGMLGPNAGQFRVQELKMLEQAFGNPNLTLGANKVVMGMVDRLNDRHILLGQMATKYLQSHRSLDSSFEDAMVRFEQRNPVFTSGEMKELAHIGTLGRGTSEPSKQTQGNAPQQPQGGGGPISTPPPSAPRRVTIPGKGTFEQRGTDWYPVQ